MKRKKHLEPVFVKVWYNKGIKFRCAVARNRVNIAVTKANVVEKLTFITRLNLPLTKKQVKFLRSPAQIAHLKVELLEEIKKYCFIFGNYREHYACLFEED